jgi:hypothetical protein
VVEVAVATLALGMLVVQEVVVIPSLSLLERLGKALLAVVVTQDMAEVAVALLALEEILLAH